MIASTYLPRRCGIATFTHCKSKALHNTFPGEIGSVRIIPIDNGIGPDGYHLGADPGLMIHQADVNSWIYVASKIRARAIETGNSPLIIYEHEHGIDAPDGNGFTSLARILDQDEELRRRGLVAVAQLHTVVQKPTPDQREQIHQLAQHCDLVTIMAKRGEQSLRESYDFDPEIMKKVRIIEHGVRPFDPLHLNEKSARENLSIDKDLHLHIVTGYRGESKGIDHIIRAFGKHLSALRPSERDRTKLAVVGMYHPWFKTPQGRPYHERDLRNIQQALEDSGLNGKYTRTSALEELGPQLLNNHVVFGEFYLNEQEFIEMQAAATVRVVGNRDREQLSSGNLAEALAHGVSIATRNEHGNELARPLYPNAPKSDLEKRTIGENAMLIDLLGRLIRPTRRGQKTILPEPSVEQLTYCMNQLQDETLRRSIGRQSIFNMQAHSWNLIERKFLYCVEEVRRLQPSA